jgi:hypothetical protein
MQFCNMLRLLWREDGSVIYSYKWYWTLSALSLSGPRPAELETIFRTGSYFVAT